MANIIRLQRNYHHPCWVGWELLSCTPWPSVYLIKQLFYKSCYSWTIWMPILAFIILFFLRLCWMSFFSSLWFSPGRFSSSGLADCPLPLMAYGYGVSKGGNTDPLHGDRYKRVGISITDQGCDLLLGHPQSDHSLQLLQITSSRVYISVMLSTHQMEGFIFTRLISTLLIHEKKHSYITGQTSIIFQFEEHFLEGG